MAHFAKINDDNDVLTVLTVDNSNASTEAEGQSYLETHNNCQQINGFNVHTILEVGFIY